MARILKQTFVQPVIKTAFVLLLIPFLSACGGGGENKETQHKIESPTTHESTESGIDLKAKSTSKGIGKYTSVELGPLDASMAEAGKAIFVSRCAICHKATDEKLIGPGLKGVTERREPEWIMNMITNAEEMEKKDPVAMELLKVYTVMMPTQALNDEETRQVLEYLRQNDAE